MATRAVETVDTDGLLATYHAASAGGDKVQAGPHIGIHVKNANAAPTNVTLVTPGTVDGNPVGDRVIAVANATEQFIAVPDVYKNSADGLADITWSVTASVTFAAIRIN